MAQAEVNTDEWKQDEFVVCLQKLDSMKSNWDLLKSFYDKRQEIIQHAQVNNSADIAGFCSEDFGLTAQASAAGGALTKVGTQNIKHTVTIQQFCVFSSLVLVFLLHFCLLQFTDFACGFNDCNIREIWNDFVILFSFVFFHCV